MFRTISHLAPAMRSSGVLAVSSAEAAAKKGYRVDFICIHWYSIEPQEFLD